MKAAFLKFNGEKAVFKKQDGSSFSLSPSVFSLEDRAFLMSLKTSAEVAASSVTESVDFAIGATIVLSVRGEASVVDPPRLSRKPTTRAATHTMGILLPACLHLPQRAAGWLNRFFGSQSGLGRIPRSRCSSVTELLPRLSKHSDGDQGFQQESFGRYEGNFSRDEEVSSSKLLSISKSKPRGGRKKLKKIELGSFDFLGRSWCSGHHL